MPDYMPPSDRGGPQVRRAYTECRFGQLHYRYAAPAVRSGKPALVMLHQNPSSSQEYLPLIAEMAKDREVYAFDTPGNGMSDTPPEPQPLDQLAGAFADGIAALGLGEERSVDLFGYHSGTYLCTELAIAAPLRVGRLVLSGLPMRSVQEREVNLAKARAVTLPGEDGDEILDWMRWLWNFTVTERLPGADFEQAVWTFRDKAAAMHRRAWTYIGVWSYDAAKRLPLVTQPVLVVQPHEPLLEASREAAAFFPDARCEELPGLSRDVFAVGIPEFARSIRSFCQ
ncbi:MULTISPECIES: alpha/beta fold hydrolase [unclassified Novosphingobium]|uniref:alpha/beta fold hydrolase n=1 Tax=unclassified Novosphingobium TaxID=2644732 RepID=UPI0013591F1B|nr:MULTISPECIES: alpha/beta hydrolase [unclassified Novosphingobium]